MNPIPFVGKAALISSTLVTPPKPSHLMDDRLVVHALVSPCAMVPVYDWPEKQESHDSPHLPHEERVTVDSGASGNFTNSSARTVSYSYTQAPFLKNFLSDKMILSAWGKRDRGRTAVAGRSQLRRDAARHQETALDGVKLSRR